MNTGTSTVDAVDVIELGQLLLCAEGQESLQRYLSEENMKAALIMLWGAANSPFLPDTHLHRHAFDQLEQLVVLNCCNKVA